MDKNFRLVCILSMILSGIVIAWNTLINFFFGVGINFVAVISIFAIIYVLVIESKPLFEETKGIFIVDLVIVCIEVVVFIMEEYFGRFGKIFYIFTVVQKILSAFAILYFVFVLLKMLFVAKEKVGGVFHNLFKANKPAKERKAKELSNGSLEEKPNSKMQQSLDILEGKMSIEDEVEE